MSNSTANTLDFTGISEEDEDQVRAAIARGENFYGYISGGEGFDFITRNYRQLAAQNILEEPWLDAYVHAYRFDGCDASIVESIFDACDRKRMRELKPLVGNEPLKKRYTAFRGCAGPNHTLGMSWTSSLDQAIWYAAHHAELNSLDNCAVYAATVAAAEIYCRLDHYEEEFIVRPLKAWRVDVPHEEFRLDRPR